MDIEKCTIIKPEYRDLALCVGDEKDFRNAIWHGDSGGKVFLKSDSVRNIHKIIITQNYCIPTILY